MTTVSWLWISVGKVAHLGLKDGNCSVAAGQVVQQLTGDVRRGRHELSHNLAAARQLLTVTHDLQQ